MTENFDLFGNRVQERFGARGRPPYERNDQDENKIKLLLALGWSNERIAHAIGISLPTLRKNYFQVLKVRQRQRDMLDAARAMKLWDLSMGGNVGAIKEFGRLMERNDAMLAEQSFRNDDRPSAPTAPNVERADRMGKKEQAQIAAEAAESSETWGDDLAFRGRVN